MAHDTSVPLLIIDDYQTMRNLLRKIGFADIDEARDGSETLEKLRHKDYGLVISDLNMAPITGFELLKEVRAIPKFN